MFDSVTDAWKHLQSESSVAMFYAAETVFSMPEFTCKFYMPWQTTQPKQMAFALPKRSPHYEAFMYQMIRLIENGVWKVRTILTSESGA